MKTKKNTLYNYRPFDIRYIDYDLSKVERHRFNVMKHLLRENVCLIALDKVTLKNLNIYLYQIYHPDINLTASAGKLGGGLVFPLFLYPDPNSIETEKIPNFTNEFIKYVETMGCNPLLSGNPEAILGYIYAVLYSPTYRKKYYEF